MQCFGYTAAKRADEYRSFDSMENFHWRLCRLLTVPMGFDFEACFFDNFELRPSGNADRSGRDVADLVIRTLESLAEGKGEGLAGRAVLSGSRARGVALKKPGWSDVDILFFLQRDRRGVWIDSFEHFEKERYGAFKLIKESLAAELPNVFAEAVVVDSECKPGFVIKLKVQRGRKSIDAWNVEISFAFDIAPNNNNPNWDEIRRQLAAMPLSKRRAQSNSFAEFRNAFLNKIYDSDNSERTVQCYQCGSDDVIEPGLRVLVRLLKAWYRVLLQDHDLKKTVCSFMLEMLALSLFSNGIIPDDFDLAKAFSTCMKFIVTAECTASGATVLSFSQEVGGGDNSNRPVPPFPQENLAWPNGLVLVDPFAPYTNVAYRKKQQSEEWRVLIEGAKQTLDFMELHNTPPYGF